MAKNLDREQPLLFIDELGASLDYGGTVGTTIGRYWNSRLKTEIDFNYANNDVDTWFQRATILGVSQTISEVPAVGVMERYSGFVNLTFALSERRVWKPNVYAGAGVGASYGKAFVQTPTELLDVDDSSLAWQWILGANYALDWNLDLYTEYRFVQAENFDVQSISTSQSLGDFEIHSHDVVFGLRLRR